MPKPIETGPCEVNETVRLRSGESSQYILSGCDTGFTAAAEINHAKPDDIVIMSLTGPNGEQEIATNLPDGDTATVTREGPMSGNWVLIVSNSGPSQISVNISGGQP